MIHQYNIEPNNNPVVVPITTAGQQKELVANGASHATAVKSENANPKKAYTPISTLFESRGQAMLKAAQLKNKSKSLSQVTSNNKPNPMTLHEQKARRLAQQALALKNRKRSPKNNVAFTEPVVTQQYEYEADMSPSMGSDDDDDNFELNTNCKSFTRVFRVRENFGSSSDDDDDDDLFTMALPDIDSDHIKKAERKAAPKRPHESIEDQEYEYARDSPPCHTDSGSGGLFSSPKVAKIAPYFDDRPQDRRVIEAKASMQNRPRATTNGNQRSRNGGGLARDAGSFLTKRKDSIHLHRRDRATELLSYKKFSSPRVNENLIVIAPTEKSDTQIEGGQPSNGYFGWFTTFLANQMNKLIF